jgi:hypothetical protein
MFHFNLNLIATASLLFLVCADTIAIAFCCLVIECNVSLTFYHLQTAIASFHAIRTNQAVYIPKDHLIFRFEKMQWNISCGEYQSCFDFLAG